MQFFGLNRDVCPVKTSLDGLKLVPEFEKEMPANFITGEIIEGKNICLNFSRKRRERGDSSL